MASSQEEEHFARFALLMFGLGTRAVRTYFDSLAEFTPQKLPRTLQREIAKIDYLTFERKRINENQRNLLFPSTGNPISSTFDMTLMVCLIRNLTKISKPVNGFDMLPLQQETTPASDFARIKYYRNFLAHLHKNEIDGTTFHSAWSVISDAIGRLSGGCLTQECKDLKTKTLDQSNLNIMKELKAVCEIDEIKKSVSELKDGPIRSLIDATSSLMEQKMKEKFYSPQTFAEDHAFELLTQNRTVIVSGIEGSGKTTLAFHLMKKIVESNSGIDNSCIPVKVNNTTDLQLVLDKAKDSNCFVILLDDPFGKSNYDSSKLDEWTQHFEYLEIKLGEGTIHMIITTRHGILEASNCELYQYPCLQKSRINLSSEKWALNYQDKREMVKLFCKAMNIDIQYDFSNELKVKETQGKEIPALISVNLLHEISSTRPMIGFPQSCFLFFSEANIFKTGLSFFKNAREGLKKEISLLNLRSEFTKKVYATLTWMLLNDGQIKLDAIEEDLVIQQELNSFVGINLGKMDLKNILKSERKYFSLDEDNVYCFSHETILESILMSFCGESEGQLLLLELAKPSLICNFVRSSGYKPDNGEICVVLNRSNDQLFLSKLIAFYSDDEYRLAHFPYSCHSELNVIWLRTFQDPRIWSMFLEERNIISCQTKLNEMFISICERGYLPLLEGVLQRYNNKYGHNEIFINKDTFRSGLKCLLEDDNVLKLQKLMEHDPTLLDLEINKEEIVSFGKIRNLGVPSFVPMIFFAIKSGSKECVEYLLRRNVDLKVFDDKQNNPLHYCVRHRWTDIIKEVIKREPQLLTKKKQRWSYTSDESCMLRTI